MVSAAFLCVVVGFITRLSSSSTKRKQDPSSFPCGVCIITLSVNLLWGGRGT